MTTVTATPPAPAPLARLRAATGAEWIKLRSVRSTKITFAAALLLTVVAGAATCAGYPHAWPGMSAAQRASFDPTQAALNGLQIAVILIGITGALVISSEYGSGLIRATFTATPQRGLVLAAKTIPFGAAALIVGTATCFATFLIGQGLLSSPVPHTTLAQPGVARAVAGGGLSLLLTGLLGLGLGALLRNTAASIGALVTLLLVVPGIAAGLPAGIKGNVVPYLPSEAANALYAVVRGHSRLSPGGGLAVMIGYVAVTLAAAVILMRRRDA